MSEVLFSSRSLTMWCVLLVMLASAVADETTIETPTSTPFRKCCPAGEAILKSKDEVKGTTYSCLGRQASLENYNHSSSPLIVGEKYSVSDGFPGSCTVSELLELDNGFHNASEDTCVDRITVEVIDDRLKEVAPRVVTLGCVASDLIATSGTDDRIVERVRKCCPWGQSYDVAYHVCRANNGATDEEWLITKLGGRDVYELDYDMRCRGGHYGVELRDSSFELQLNGSQLLMTGESDDVAFNEGDWCIEREMDSESSLVVRGCTTDCIGFGAYCVRKCCTMNHHYEPLFCNSTRSRCVPDNKNASSFDLSSQLKPLREENGVDFGEIVGLRAEGLRCSEGYYVLDQYRMTETGKLAQFNISDPPTLDYCLETFDYTFCGRGLHIDALLCFNRPTLSKKNFFMAFVAFTISCVFMALTLLVYGVIPELQNLHGKTLMSHVSAMLLGYGCLARVNWGHVADKRLCAVLGYGVYFGFVAAFAWLNVMCLDIWWTFGSVRTVQRMRKSDADLRRFGWYSLHAWGAAVGLTVIMLLLDLYPLSPYLDANIGEGVCWFSADQNTESDWPHYIFFVIPMGIVTCTNLVLWVLTARHCARVRSEVHRLQAGSIGDRAKRRFRIDRQKYILTGKLWVVMGAGWVWEVASTFTSEPKWFWDSVDLINSLQGCLIFAILVVKPKVYRLMKKRLGLTTEDPQKKNMASSGRTSTTYLSRTISGNADDRVNLRTSYTPNKSHES